MIAIPNMSKPKSCWECRLMDGEANCLVTDEGIPFKQEGILPDCPLIEIDLERDIPTIWYNRQTGQYEPKGTKQEVYERLYKLKNGERRSDEHNRKTLL